MVELVDHVAALRHRPPHHVAGVAQRSLGGKVLQHQHALLVADVVELLLLHHAVHAHHVHVGRAHQAHVGLVPSARHVGLQLLGQVVGAAAEDALAVHAALPGAGHLAQVAQPDAVAHLVEHLAAGAVLAVRAGGGGDREPVQVLLAHVPRPPQPRLVHRHPQLMLGSPRHQLPDLRRAAVLGPGEVVRRHAHGQRHLLDVAIRVDQRHPAVDPRLPAFRIDVGGGLDPLDRDLPALDQVHVRVDGNSRAAHGHGGGGDVARDRGYAD